MTQNKSCRRQDLGNRLAMSEEGAGVAHVRFSVKTFVEKVPPGPEVLAKAKAPLRRASHEFSRGLSHAAAMKLAGRAEKKGKPRRAYAGWPTSGPLVLLDCGPTADLAAAKDYRRHDRPAEPLRGLGVTRPTSSVGRPQRADPQSWSASAVSLTLRFPVTPSSGVLRARHPSTRRTAAHRFPGGGGRLEGAASRDARGLAWLALAPHP